MNDWASLSNEFIRVFDSIDLSGKTKRASSKQTNLKGSQYIAALHRDSKVAFSICTLMPTVWTWKAE